ncbi:MAG: hypothetical protein ACKVH8_08125 [Pirellulales bacterium]
MKKILHVDDSSLILHMVSAELTKGGYQVVSLKDPTKTVQTLADLDIRICILDMEMDHWWSVLNQHQAAQQ